jgi:hypothetical protein
MLSTSTVTISLSSPLVVSGGNVIGLGFEFDIRKSRRSMVRDHGVEPDSAREGDYARDADAFIDEFVAA